MKPLELSSHDKAVIVSLIRDRKRDWRKLMPEGYAKTESFRHLCEMEQMICDSDESIPSIRKPS